MASVRCGRRPCRTWHETKDDLHVTFELPGILEKDVTVSIASDVLTLPKIEAVKPKEIKID